MDILTVPHWLNCKNIIIYGAGKIGQIISSSLISLGFEIDFFWDRNADVIDKFTDIPIMKPDFESIPKERRGQYLVIVTVSAKNISKEIANVLSELGYNHVVHDRETINQIIYQTCNSNLSCNNFFFDLTTCRACPVYKENKSNASCDIFDRFIAENFANGVSLPIDKREKLIIPKLGLLISNKCNLCCAGCNHLVDLYKPGDTVEFTPDELFKDLSKIVEAADLINQVTIVGGEAFLHPKLSEILEMVLDLPKIGFIEIITNGSVKPREPRLFELMANKRIVVEISGYGAGLPSVPQKNIQDFISELKRCQINYHCMNTLQWFNFGDFNFRQYSKEQQIEMYRTCCSVSNDIFNGRLYKCSRSALGTFLGKIPDYPQDYVDLHKYSKDELRQKLLKHFTNESPQACLHCNGALVVISAGVQILRFSTQ